MRIQSLLAGVAVAIALPFAANASTVYDNIGPAAFAGDCSFNTTCAAAVGRGNEFAAQAFSLSTGASITDGSYTVLESGGPSASVNWAFYASGGATPTGAALASGNSAAVTTFLSSLSGYNVNLVSFNLGTVNLAAGNYFFAIQEVTGTFASFLQPGLITSGAAETNDGGITWAPGYENLGGGAQLGGISVALASNSAAPEPAAWALMIGGFGLAGVALRRRRSVAAAA